MVVGLSAILLVLFFNVLRVEGYAILPECCLLVIMVVSREQICHDSEIKKKEAGRDPPTTFNRLQRVNTA